jgi:hypothetical protein
MTGSPMYLAVYLVLDQEVGCIVIITPYIRYIMAYFP